MFTSLSANVGFNPLLAGAPQNSAHHSRRRLKLVTGDPFIEAGGTTPPIFGGMAKSKREWFFWR